jgi:DNA ligase (NAD+)
MRNEIEELASKILYHKKLYYKGNSVISDEEFDKLEDRLRQKDPNHPVLSVVGYQMESKGQKVHHEIPMLSLAKTYSKEDLLAFLNKHHCMAIEKLDGMALSLEYDETGKLQVASTRGNGVSGENVTEHVYHILHIPKRIHVAHGAEIYRIEVRGEVYFPISKFRNFEDTFDSLRNAVPGTLGRKDVDQAMDILHVLEFLPYDILFFDQKGHLLSSKEIEKVFHVEPDYFEKLMFIQKLGFHVHEEKKAKEINQNINLEELNHFIEHFFEKKRDYHVDGIVFRIRDEVLWESLGNTAHHPRGSLAFKQAGETAQTEILDIEENVGRSGKITFRAKLNPVFLSGAKISYATLHNAEFIEQGHYSVGSEVEVIRSGEVIPSIIRLIKHGPHSFKLPTECQCGAPLTRHGPDLFCTQKGTCSLREQESLTYFVSALDMLGISDKIVLKLRESGLVKEPADFYKLAIEDLLQLEGFAQKSSENVIATIQSHKKIPLAKFLTALGLKRGGAVKCAEVARKCTTLSHVLDLKPEDLMTEKGWAEKSAQDFVRSLHEKKELIEHLLEHVDVISDHSQKKVQQQKDHPYFGKNICITGALSRPRDEYKKSLEAIGAKLVSSVTSKTDFLVCNEESHSSKYKDAKKYGIPILTEEEFVKNL